MQTHSIAILGVSGRLGRAILLESLLYDNFKLAGAVVRAGSDWDGIDLGQAPTLTVEVIATDPDLVLD